MPTAFTSDILEGKITTFEEFAKSCILNFEAAIHMRNETVGTPYKKRIPDENNYHKNGIIRTEEKIVELEKMSDSELEEDSKRHFEDAILRYKKSIVEDDLKESRLRAILDKVLEWIPPTEDHINYKNFMIEQLENTIKWDCSQERSRKYIDDLENSIKNLDGKKIRESRKEELARSLKYHQENLENDIKICENSNNWVEEILKTFKNE